MQTMIKNFTEAFGASSPIDYEYPHPAACPHCSISCDPVIVKPCHVEIQEQQFILLVLRCTSCKKLFVATYLSENKVVKSFDIIPKNATIFHDSLFVDLSPRFIDIYNQALRARDNNDFELASIGYRAAIEILIKDYAIKELNKPESEVVKKSLYNAIAEYLKPDNLIPTADVIRILGNDNAHYERKYSQYSFEIIQQYMDIMIGVIRAHLLMTHTPVSR